MRKLARFLALVSLATPGCSDPEPETCGPPSARVARVIDGDTVELEDGTVVRYLLIDTPESTSTVECFGPEARAANRSLVEHQRVELRYDRECSDRYGRLLAYVSAAGEEVNTRLVADGFACSLHVPPNGDGRVAEFEALERSAEGRALGLWGACSERPCEGRHR